MGLRREGALCTVVGFGGDARRLRVGLEHPLPSLRAGLIGYRQQPLGEVEPWGCLAVTGVGMTQRGGRGRKFIQKYLWLQRQEAKAEV